MAMKHGRTASDEGGVSFDSSFGDLVDGFAWAVRRAHAWVQQDTPVPSYWAGLTDRPMFYSRDVCHQALAGHLLGLDVENRAMLETFAASSTERRGLYPLWAFLFDGTPAPIDYHSDDDFVREVPAVYEIVETLVQLARWTGDHSYLTDASFDKYIRSVVTDFAPLHDVLHTGIAGAAGTGDIFVGSATYNEGRKAPGLMIAGDGVASQWAAMKAVATSHPDASLRAFADAEQERLSAVFDRDWFDTDRGRYVTGFSAGGPVPAFAYEPSWFPAVKSLLPPGERADAHLDFIARELALDPPRNIEAFTYLPEAFLNYGRDDEALAWIRFLIKSRANYPEVSFTIVSHLTVGLSGARILGDDTIATRSHVDEGWIASHDLPWADGRISIRHDAHASSTLRNDRRVPVRWHAQFSTGMSEHTVAPGEELCVSAP